MKYLVLLECRTVADKVVCYCKNKKAAEEAASSMLIEWKKKHGTLNDTRLVIAEVVYSIEG